MIPQIPDKKSTSRGGADDHPLLKKFKFGKVMQVLFDSSLGKAIKKIMAEAICSGEVEPSSVINMNMRSLQADDLGTLLRPNVDRILGLAKPSPYGQGNDTVFDDNVRKGLELVANQFSIAHEDELLQGIRTQIQQKLFPVLPGGPEAVTLKRYKMAIYQEGGHFQFHRDSLHADNHQATLLLEVRSAHEGGKFVIDHYGRGGKNIEVKDKYGNVNTYDAYFEMGFDGTSSDSTPLKWIAFYTDALHKVERVTSGNRIVIQYDVYIDTEMPSTESTGADSRSDSDHEGKSEEDIDTDSNENSNSDCDSQSNRNNSRCQNVCNSEEDSESEEEGTPYLENTLTVFSQYKFPCISNIAMRKVLTELDKHITTCGKKNVAIPLFHRYSVASIKHEFLKGPDRLLFDAIVKEKKYVLGLSPVVITAESDYEGNFNHKSYSVTFTDPMTVCYKWDAAANDILAKPIKKGHNLNSSDCMYVVSKREEFWTIASSTYKEWVGNESEPALHKYFLGVIVVGRN